MNDEQEKRRFLERILIGNILSFAKGVGWHIDREIEVSIHSVPKLHKLSFKKYQMMGFDTDFVSNIIIPNNIGLGKSVSRGLKH